MPTCGIYKLSIVGDDGQERFYYGRSTDVRRRVWQHLRDLKRGVHYNDRMQRTYDKYRNITTSTVAVCDEDCVAAVEGMFIHTHINDRMCLNQAKVDPDGRVRLSDETRRRMSVVRLGRKLSDLHRSSIAAGKRGKPSSCRGSRRTNEQRVRMRDAKKNRWRPIVLNGPSGDEFYFPGLSFASAYLSVSPSNLCRCLNGDLKWPRRGRMAGWTGSYIDKEEL